MSNIRSCSLDIPEQGETPGCLEELAASLEHPVESPKVTLCDRCKFLRTNRAPRDRFAPELCIARIESVSEYRTSCDFWSARER